MLLIVAAALALHSRSVVHLHGRSVGTRTSGISATDRCETAALLFDVEGVLVETEVLQRKAYNEAFSALGLEVGGAPVRWSVQDIRKLKNMVSGSPPASMLRYYFLQTCKGVNKALEELHETKKIQPIRPVSAVTS